MSNKLWYLSEEWLGVSHLLHCEADTYCGLDMPENLVPDVDASVRQCENCSKALELAGDKASYKVKLTASQAGPALALSDAHTGVNSAGANL